jgi:diadenosine tetraphosphatase ApaH/serine/threonine PP2A family protein phosphatase
MRYAILADIHSNLTALNAVLDDIAKQGKVDELWCLGDIVGYGPEPDECISLLRKLNAVCVAGNHDVGAIGKIDLIYFNPLAAQALEWTAEKLNPVDLRYLEDLPKSIDRGNFLLVHGSPSSPLFEYIISISSAERNFSFFQTRYCLVGHTHAPAAFRQEGKKVSAPLIMPGRGILFGDEKVIINPGAVGQPRDGDPRASYGIFDTEDNFFRLFRVEYDIRATQDKMVQAGLPLQLVMRLEAGK